MDRRPVWEAVELVEPSQGGSQQRSIVPVGTGRDEVERDPWPIGRDRTLEPLFPSINRRATVPPAQIIGWFVARWPLKVTFHEVRANVGVETQRQWSDLAILRTTPALLGHFSLVTLVARARLDGQPLLVRHAAWYVRSASTFS